MQDLSTFLSSQLVGSDGDKCVNNMERKGEWVKFKLKEVLNNPSFLGKTVRLGDLIFQVKGIRYSSTEKVPYSDSFIKQ